MRLACTSSRRQALSLRRLAAGGAILALGLQVSGIGCGLDTSGGSGGPKHCTKDVDCADDNLCDVDGCGDSNVCTHTPAPDGEAGLQVPGDCQLVRCEGGEAVPEEDPTDVDDGNPCTIDACEAGVGSHEPVEDEQCTVGGSEGTCQQGMCVVPCEETDTCDDAKPCTLDSCDLAAGGICAHQPNHGALVEDGIDDDCLQLVCNQDMAVPVAQDGEIPDDQNPCTIDSCVDGAPSYQPNTGASCGGTQKCNDQGQCVGCLDGTDCPGTDDECQYRTCDGAGVCGMFYQPWGTPVSGQSPGDCKLAICDGSGGVTTTADGGDVPPDDGLPCTSSACSGDVPYHSPVAVDTPCPGGVCNSTGVCVACNSDGQCPPADACNLAVCSNNACTVIDVTAGDDPKNDCAEQTAQSCGTTGRCDGAGNCAYHPAGTGCAAGGCSGGVETAPMTCNGAGSCSVGGGTTSCGGYACNGNSCGTTCSGGMGCVSTHYCVGGICVPKLVTGTSCTAGPECVTGHCVDGVCCGTPCTGLCRACSASKTGGSDGVCGNVMSNTDPDMECSASTPMCCSGAMCGASGCS